MTGPTGLVAVYDNTLKTQQRAWIKEALSLTTYPIAHFPVTITYRASPNLPVADHNAYMCTDGVDGSGVYETVIQPWADTESSPDIAQSLTGFDLKQFFLESVVHELMHVAQFQLAFTNVLIDELASCFQHTPATGFAPRIGTLADYHPTGAAWEERIQEAIAEAGKDIWMPEAFRYYDNRTNWNLLRPDL